MNGADENSKLCGEIHVMKTELFVTVVMISIWGSVQMTTMQICPSLCLSLVLVDITRFNTTSLTMSDLGAPRQSRHHSNMAP